MGKALIIAEKPSLAKNIATAIGCIKNWVNAPEGKTGYYENDMFVVSYAFGHLFELCDAADYNPDYKDWDVDDLPIIPESFKYRLKDDAGIKAQYKMLKRLITSEDIVSIINAGDSDREGEIIIRNILRKTGTQKPVYRLWMPDQTAKTINKELAAMKKDSEYDDLANEGYARTYIDWLFGINLTRLASVKSGQTLRVGRVTTPIISAICERERAIRDFKPRKYYIAKHEIDGLVLDSKEEFDTDAECQTLCDEYNGLKTYVKEKKRTKTVIPRPKLFALSDLQGVAGRQYKLSPKDTLDGVQALYEAGFVTYPRTDSQYMATAEKQKAKDIIEALQKAYPNKMTGISFRDSKDIFDDSKVETHSGITPTDKMPDLKKLPEMQKNLYGAILARFCAVFCTEDYTVDRTKMVITNGKEDFSVSGDILLTPGYTVYEPNTKKDVILPPLNQGDEIVPGFAPAEKTTKPPDHYTSNTLMAYLRNPYSKQEKKDMSEDAETKEVISDIQLGTEATRAGLIDSAIKSGYISLSKNVYGITELGEFYVDTLAKLGIDMAKSRTLELSKMLKQVYRRQATQENVVQSAVEDLRDICKSCESAKTEKKSISKEAICKCPKCGNDIVENSKAFSCTNKECKVAIFKDNKFFASIGLKPSRKFAELIFTKGAVKASKLRSKRTGKEFSAIIKMTVGDSYPAFELVFDNPPKK